MFDPTVGRWFEEDPAGLDVDPNPYEYAGNNPTNNTDPSGMEPPPSKLPWQGTGPLGHVVPLYPQYWLPGPAGPIPAGPMLPYGRPDATGLFTPPGYPREENSPPYWVNPNPGGGPTPWPLKSDLEFFQLSGLQFGVAYRYPGDEVPKPGGDAFEPPDDNNDRKLKEPFHLIKDDGRKRFPRLERKNYWCTDKDEVEVGYNCYGWAVARQKQNVRLESKTLFEGIAFYKSKGYSISADCNHVPGKTKIALFADKNGILQHAAIEYPGRAQWWESKMGSSARIIHQLKDLESDYYGTVRVCMEK